MHPLIKIQDELYVVKKTIKENTLVKDLDIDYFKKYYICDTIFKKDGIFYFVEKVECAEIIPDEEIKVIE
jgi:hypothetical protein